MNFLAHAYLSFDDPQVLTGNMISDFVKGKKKFDYPARILEGIHLHRAIDEFTDTHEVTREAGRCFKPEFGLYSAAFMDVVYDHFLGLQLAAEGETRYRQFSKGVYEKLEWFEYLFPDKFRMLFPYMKQHDWLYNYQFPWGIERSFQGLVHRAAYLTSAEPAMRIFLENYEQLGRSFSLFFPQLMDFSLKKFADIH